MQEALAASVSWLAGGGGTGRPKEAAKPAGWTGIWVDVAFSRPPALPARSIPSP